MAIERAAKVRIRLNRRGIPKEVLEGKVRKFASVHQIYKTTLYNNMFRKLHQSFFDRAFWGTDKTGDSWVPLKDSTEAIKNKMMELGESVPHQTGNFKHKRQLSPDQLREYKTKFSELKSKGVSERHSGRLSLKEIFAVEGDETEIVEFDKRGRRLKRKKVVQKTPINIRTAKLAEAFSPAEVANNRVYAGPYQKIELHNLKLRFEIVGLPYAKEGKNGLAPVEGPYGDSTAVEEDTSFDVDSFENDDKPSGTYYRILIGPSQAILIQESHDEAINVAKTEYDRIRSLEKREKRGKSNNENPTRNRRPSSREVQNKRRPT